MTLGALEFKAQKQPMINSLQKTLCKSQLYHQNCRESNAARDYEKV